MKSPFPGMDPYLEARWSDVHVKLIAYMGEALQGSLPSGLRARAEQRVLLEDVGGEPITSYRSDIAVVDGGRRERRDEGATATLPVPEPYSVRFYDEPQIDRFLQIIDTTSGNRVVTAIELLSPWNKGPGRLNADYCRKIADYATAGVNLVEIDLLRMPRGRLRVNEGDLPPERRTPYYVVAVRPATSPERWDVYSIPLRAPIPPVKVPLRPTDSPAILQLQPLIERVYTAGGHDDIDYSKPPAPPLSPEDEAWADELLRTVGRR
jgi:hypothetical protein